MPRPNTAVVDGTEATGTAALMVVVGAMPKGPADAKTPIDDGLAPSPLNNAEDADVAPPGFAH